MTMNCSNGLKNTLLIGILSGAGGGSAGYIQDIFAREKMDSLVAQIAEERVITRVRMARMEESFKANGAGFG